MIVPADIDIFVAARRPTPPTLPLREELIQLGIECIYRPKKRFREVVDYARFRMLARMNRMSTKDLLKGNFPPEHFIVGPEEENVAEDGYLPEELKEDLEKSVALRRNDSAHSASTITMSITDLRAGDPLMAGDTNSIITRTDPLTIKIQYTMEDIRKEINGPSLTHSGSLGDMTRDTVLLVGKTSSVAKGNVPPPVIFTKAEAEDNRWFYEANESTTGKMSSNGIVDDFLKDQVLSREESKTEVYNLSVSEIAFTSDEFKEDLSHTDDVSALVDSVCGLWCGVPDLMLPEQHDLALKKESDDDLRIVEAQQSNQLSSNSSELFKNPHDLPVKNNQQLPTQAEIMSKQLFSMVAESNPKPEAIKFILEANPVAITDVNEDERLPLHVLCDKNLPDRTGAFMRRCSKNQLPDDFEIHTIINNVTKDIVNRRVMLKVVAWSHRDACCTIDKNGDLPVHLLARRLKQWSSNVQHFIRDHVKDISDIARFATVSKTVSECIDIVLAPVATRKDLHNVQGSVGRLLPIHIAVMFTSAFEIFTELLERSSACASITYISDDPMIPKHMLPLEILEEMKRDQEIYTAEMNEGDRTSVKGIRWSASIPDNFCAQDFTRRSDLLFAFYPCVMPYRRDERRLKRLESMIRSEIRQEGGNLSEAAKRFWTWMCKFRGTGQADIYLNSVERVVAELSQSHLIKILDVRTATGKLVLEEAIPEIKEILSQTMIRAQKGGHVKKTDPGRRKPMMKQGSILKKTNRWKEGNKCRDNIAQLCNTIFNVQEESLPTSFVIFPFEIKPSFNGTNALVTEKDSALAVEYAKFLLNSVSCNAILQTLEHKQNNRALGDEKTEQMRAFLQSEEKSVNKLFQNRVGYLYFLDESTGIPISKSTMQGAKYPIPIENPVPTIIEIFPLMRKGMALMRGIRTLIVLAEVLTQSTLQVKPCCWKAGAEDILQWFDNNPSSDNNDGEKSVSSISQKGDEVRHQLKHFISSTQGHYGSNEIEWTSEMRLLQQIMNSANLSYSKIGPMLGLKKIPTQIRTNESHSSIWTKGVNQPSRIISRVEVEKVLQDENQNEEAKSMFEPSLNSLSPQSPPRVSIAQPSAASVASSTNNSMLKKKNDEILSLIKQNNKSRLSPMRRRNSRNRVEVEQKIAQLNKFLSDKDDDSFGRKAGTTVKSTSSTQNTSKMTGSSLKAKSKFDILSSSSSEDIFSLGLTENTTGTKTDTDVFSESSTSRRVVERKKLTMRVRLAQLEKCNRAYAELCGETIDENESRYETISLIENTVANLDRDLEAYDKRLYAAQQESKHTRDMKAVISKNFEEFKSEDVLSLGQAPLTTKKDWCQLVAGLEKSVAVLEGQIDEVKKKIETKQEDIFSQRLEI